LGRGREVCSAAADHSAALWSLGPASINFTRGKFHRVRNICKGPSINDVHTDSGRGFSQKWTYVDKGRGQSHYDVHNEKIDTT